MIFMVRKIIRIDESKCDGCGICATACHEGAIDIVDGKAKLVREHFCDGLGDCLPACPQGAISFEEREAPAYDEDAVKESQKLKLQQSTHNALKFNTPCSCPGSQFVSLQDREKLSSEGEQSIQPRQSVSRLNQWPCQIKLLPVQAPFYDGAKLLICADCCAYAYANIHEDFMKGKITLIGCPKLDAIDYSEKLTEIIKNNDIKSVTVLRMEVPCCGGLEMAAKNALQASGQFIPWQVVTISRDGNILE